MAEEEWHLSLSVHKLLWDQILSAALPIKVGNGSYHLLRDARRTLSHLNVSNKVALLLEQKQPPLLLLKARDKATKAWSARREKAHKVVDGILHVEGSWDVRIRPDGSEFRYASQQVGFDAKLGIKTEGTAKILGERFEKPFVIDKAVTLSIELLDIRYDQGKNSVIGTLARPKVVIGENQLFQVLERVLELGIEQQLGKINPISILPKDQVESLVSPASGPLKVQMGVEDLVLEVTEESVTLKVRFGFNRKQIEEV